MSSIIETINGLTLFLSNVGACLIAILVFEVIRDAANKNVSIFTTHKNTRLYCLSFIYDIARNMKLEGKSDGEIQKELQRRYNAKALPFMMSSQLSPKMIDAINFVWIVLNDSNLLFSYVATPTFGKSSYKELLSKINSKEEDRNAEFALKNILIDSSNENVQRCKKWLPALCTRPFVEDLSECGERDKGGRNEALLYLLLKPGEGEVEDSSVFVFKANTSQRGFVDCMLKLKECYPSMEVVKLTAFSRQYNIVSGGGKDVRAGKRIKYTEKIKKLCQDFGK